ncbi:hypothetical protein [Paenibacillus thalictri]|uniref:Uncharacterized protein n=1 Tax=Paenibacillus thalictri TaxID=2527873 RepID=A0A4Q9DRJ7_9BACL|nr:hypothetical protein [Paenibacillus thalictri]TBL79389.1 hypothetical protein EYB31_10755 [Paenibacillus thalictri]
MKTRITVIVLSLIIGFSLFEWGHKIGPPFSIPKALVLIESGSKLLVPLDVEQSRFVGRRGLSQEALNTYLREHGGWAYRENMGSMLIYGRNGETLMVEGRFSRGYWWYKVM